MAFRTTKAKKRKRIFLITKVILGVFIVSSLFYLSYYVFSLDSLKIKEVKVFGTKIIKEEDVLALVQEELSGKYIWLYPKSNVIIYPKDKIESILKDEYKRIENVEVSRNNKEVSVFIKEREPKSIWCTNSGDFENCYLIDKNGYIFDFSDRNENLFKYYGDVFEDVPIGQYFLKEDFDRLENFREDLLKIEGFEEQSHFTFTEDGDLEIYFKDGKKIIFSIDQDFNQLSSRLNLIVKNKKLGKIDDFENLEYVDLRFGSKVFYR